MHRPAVVLGLAALLACGHQRPAPLTPLPETPEAAVSAFLDAVNASDLVRLAEVWGDASGPSSTGRMKPEERRQRLMIMQRVLRCDHYRIVSVASVDREELVTAELTQGNRHPMVPFRVVRWRRGAGWLVREPGIAAAMPAAGPRQPN